MCFYHFTAKYNLGMSGNVIINQQRKHQALVKPRKYEEDRNNCSTQIFLRKAQLLKYFVQNIKTQEVCNFGYFNNYLKRYGQFAGEGVWYAPPTGAPSVQVDFNPSGCSFMRVSRGDYVLRECLQMKNISKILVTGDSNGRMLTQNMIQIFERVTGKKCKKIVFQDAENNTKYFFVPHLNGSKLSTNPCGFGLRTCASWKYQCPIDDSNNVTFQDNVTIEYISMLHIIELQLKLSLAERHGNGIKRLLKAENKLEYILKYYLPYKGFPDMWIFTPPFHHDSWYKRLSDMKIDIHYLMKVLNTYVPNRTTIVFMADSRECPGYRPYQTSKAFLKTWNITRNERIDQMNRLWYEVIRPNLDNSKNWNVFLDATKISCPLVCTWHADGAHFVGVWYKLMSEYILSTACHS